MALDCPTALVVDDDAPSVELILHYLGEIDLQAETASDGEEAWELLKSRPDDFDVILLDRYMPRMDGVQLLRKIKGHDRLRALPVIMQTSANARSNIIEGIEAGAYYYLTKPLDRHMLLAIVDAALADYARYLELRQQAREEAGTFALLSSGRFDFRSIEEANSLGAFLAKLFPDPERVTVGLSELLVNAVEHGNLEISYEEKGRLQDEGALNREVARRLALERFAGRTAEVVFSRRTDAVSVIIRDQGLGFDPGPFLKIDPDRAFHTHGRGIAIANLMSFDRLEFRDEGREVEGTVDLQVCTEEDQ